MKHVQSSLIKNTTIKIIGINWNFKNLLKFYIKSKGGTLERVEGLISLFFKHL